jgi:3-oxoadipate enol-lactonase
MSDGCINVADGRRIRYRVDGCGERPWIVFANSIATDMSIWDEQVAMLAQGFRVLRFDQRGHGQSSNSAGPCSFDDYGSDVLVLLDAQGIEECAFVGLSMGVPTGLAAMRFAPGRVSAFVAVDGVAKSAPGREAFWTERRTTAQAQGMAEIADGTVARWLPGEPDDSITSAKLREMFTATSVEGYAAATEALQRYDYSDIAAQIRCPFLGIAGALDGAMPDAMHAQFGAIPGVEFATIPNAGHLPNFQSPAAFNAVLGPFLEHAAHQTSPEV